MRRISQKAIITFCNECFHIQENIHNKTKLQFVMKN
jgi:hypothetical protein